MEENFKKNNICPLCEGKKSLPGHKDGEIKCVCEDGTYIGYMLDWHLEMTNRQLERTSKDYKELQDWVKKTSQCKTCGGNQWKTFGLLTCNECGLPGLAYWPG